MSRKKKTCPVCGIGSVAEVQTRRPMPFSHAAAVAPAWPVAVPTCDHCNEQFINAATARALDAALASTLQNTQTRIIEESIASLATVKTPREWEKRLGLSPGYFSRLKAGKEGSVALTTLLAFLARSPARAWNQLEEMWAEPESKTPARTIDADRHASS